MRRAPYPMTLPDDPPPTDFVGEADERATLMTFLGHQRTMPARKASGISEEQARLATCPNRIYDAAPLEQVEHSDRAFYSLR